MTTWRHQETSSAEVVRQKVKDLPDGTVYEDDDGDIYLKLSGGQFVHFSGAFGCVMAAQTDEDILNNCKVARTFNIILEGVR